MKNIRLEWKEFNVDIESVSNSIKTIAGDTFLGIQSHDCLELWFSEEPKEDVKDAIADFWKKIKKTSFVAKNYESKEEALKTKEAKKASAAAKLLALGLDEEEVQAILN
jgi:hypothetical protein